MKLNLIKRTLDFFFVTEKVYWFNKETCWSTSKKEKKKAYAFKVQLYIYTNEIRTYQYGEKEKIKENTLHPSLLCLWSN